MPNSIRMEEYSSMENINQIFRLLLVYYAEPTDPRAFSTFPFHVQCLFQHKQPFPDAHWVKSPFLTNKVQFQPWSSLLFAPGDTRSMLNSFTEVLQDKNLFPAPFWLHINSCPFSYGNFPMQSRESIFKFKKITKKGKTKSFRWFSIWTEKFRIYELANKTITETITFRLDVREQNNTIEFATPVCDSFLL